MNKLYSWRGFILGFLALSLLIFPAATFPKLPVGFTPEWEPIFLSVLLLLVSVIVRVQARRSIGEHTRGSKHDADHLVTSGLYEKIRHPLYLSNMGVGYSAIVYLYGFSLIALPFVLLLLAFEIILSRGEDKFLEEKFGDAWREWAKKTGAFIPLDFTSALQLKKIKKTSALLANAEASAVPPKRSVGQSIAADSSTWFWLVVLFGILTAKKILGF